MALTELAAFQDVALAAFIEGNRGELIAYWRQHVNTEAAGTRPLLAILDRQLEGRYDVLCVLHAGLKGDEHLLRALLRRLIDQLRTDEGSISALYLLVTALRDSFDSVLFRSDGLSAGDRASLKKSAQHLLARTFLEAFEISESIPKASALETRIFDGAALPVLKMDTELRLMYANPEARRLLGVLDLAGMTVRDIVPDPAQQKILAAHLQKRQSGSSSLYDVEVTRPSDKKKIPVRVLGIPVTDEQGRTTGSIGIIRSLEIEKLGEAIHARIGTEQDLTGLLGFAAEQVRTIVPFDLFTVSQYSRDMCHVSALFIYAPDAARLSDRRWYALTPALRNWINDVGATVVPDLREFYERQEWRELLRDREVVKFLDIGFQSFLRIPITREGRIVASIVLMSRNKAQYDDQHLEILQKLPLDAAVQMALYYRDRSELEFRYALLQKLPAASSLGEMAEHLVSAIAAHYRWDRAAAYRVDHATGQFRLLAQSPATGASLAGEEGPIENSVLGYVYRTREDVNIANIREDRKFGGIRVRVDETVNSELCLPIAWDGEVRWILKMEDQRESAFSGDEARELRSLLDDVCLILKQLEWQHLLRSAVESSADAMIITTSGGRILYANPTTAKLLGYEEITSSIQELFGDEEIANTMLESGAVEDREVPLRAKDGGTKKVFVSCGQLPKHLGGKVFVAKDLTEQALKRSEALEEKITLLQRKLDSGYGT